MSSCSKLYKSMKRFILTSQQQNVNGFPHHGELNKVIINAKRVVELQSMPSVKLALDERICNRCNTIYKVDGSGMQVNRGDPGCSYHWGSSYQRRGYKTPYTCCNRDSNSKGCTVNKWHVSDTGNLASQKEFVRTVEKPQPSADGDYGVYALDCEMCYTTGGGELTRIAVISSDYKMVYETLVMPDNPILDYNTRFSGITKEDLVDVKTTLKDVQAFLLNLLSSKTILIGHGLDGDLRALGMIHDTVIDTSVIFPHSQGPPFRRALKTLCQEYLKKSIRNGGVHNCSEDAIACMELVIWKIKH